jgi:hypothetical protein
MSDAGLSKKTLEVYDILQLRYQNAENTCTKSGAFHFNHGDLGD